MLALLIALWASTANGQDSPIDGYPMNGFVQISGTANFIQYSCKKQGSGDLECEMIQLIISKKAKPEELLKRLERLKDFDKEMSSWKGADQKECLHVEAYLGMLQGKQAAGTLEPSIINTMKNTISNMSEAEKKDTIDTTGDLQKLFCEKPNKEVAERLIRKEFEKDTRTCNILPNRYIEIFKKVSPTKWVRNEGPDGECGIIRVSEFDLEDEKNPFLWNYTTRKIVTNKAGSAILLKCSDFDEELQKYAWSTSPVHKGCDYIKMGF